MAEKDKENSGQDKVKIPECNNNLLPDGVPEDISGLEETFFSGGGISSALGIYYKKLADSEVLSAEKESELWDRISGCCDRIRALLAHFGCVYAHFLHLLESCETEEDLGDLFPQSFYSGKGKEAALLRKLPEIRLEYARIHESLFAAHHCSDESLRKKLYKQGEKLLKSHPFLRELILREVTLLQNHLLVVDSSEKESADQLLNTELLCRKEDFLKDMEQLSEQIRILDRERDLLVESNLRLVMSIARHYQNRGVLLVDLVQEGNIGLLKAIEKFDHLLGHRFSTYATWWIKQSVAHAVRSQSRVIRLPVHMLSMLSRINKAEQQFLQEKGREASVDEIAEQMGLSRSRVSSLKRMALQPISLQASVYSRNSGKEIYLEETVNDIHDGDDPVKSLARKLLEQKLHTLLDSLPERTKQILIFRFGLNGVKPMSLNEMSQHFHVSRERIRQIENNALMHLRNPEMISMLEDYFL